MKMKSLFGDINTSDAFASLFNEKSTYLSDMLTALETAANPTPKKKSVTAAHEIRETAEKYVIMLDVPGISKENITLKVDGAGLEGNKLTVTATRDESLKSKDVKVFESTLSYRTIENVYQLSEGLDIDSITPTLINGVLTITIDKVVKEKSKSFEIKLS